MQRGAYLEEWADPSPGVPELAIYHEALTLWAKVDGGVEERPPCHPRHIVGQGKPGWRLTDEASVILGTTCEVCRGRTVPAFGYCLGCAAIGAALQRFLTLLPRDSFETEPGARKARDLDRDRDERRQEGLAERRWAAEIARSEARAKARAAAVIQMVGPGGECKVVRASMVQAYRRCGWRTATDGQGARQ